MEMLVQGAAALVFSLAACTAATADAALCPAPSIAGPLAASVADYGRRLAAERPPDVSAVQQPQRQTTADDSAWRALASTPRGRAVVVTGRSTKPVTGALAEVTADEIRLTDLAATPPAVTRIPRADVLEVRTTPHRHTAAHAKRGFWIGAAAGALLCAAAFSQVEEGGAGGAASGALVGVLYGGPIGAGVGAIVSSYPSPKSDLLYLAAPAE